MRPRECLVDRVGPPAGTERDVEARADPARPRGDEGAAPGQPAQLFKLARGPRGKQPVERRSSQRRLVRRHRHGCRAPGESVDERQIGGIAIRGIASGDNKGFEQSVAMFVDGVYYGRDQLSRLPLVDMERVEVLRGPQPTLFGKNAIAGAVNITTRSPTDEFEGTVSGLYEFNHKELQLTGVLSGPLSDGVEARVVGYHRSMDGYFYNQKLKRNEPNVDEYYVRGKVEFDKDGPLAAELKLEYADFAMKGQPRDVFGAVGNYNAVFQGPFFVSTVPDYVREDNGYESRNKVFGATLNADLEIGEHTLTSVICARIIGSFHKSCV